LKRIVFLFLLFLNSIIWAQQDSLFVVEPDDKYVEDQFYFGINYNLLVSAPDNASQSSFSYGIMGGFIKDIPINKRRNIGFGIGVGLSFNAIYSDLLATQADNGSISYQIVPDDISYNRNNLTMNFVEFPIEFRWRSSKADDYRFWRIYSGIKLSYLISGNSKFVADTETIKFSNKDIRDMQYGVYFSFGYNTWNFYAQYDLSNIFEDNTYTIDGDLMDTQIFKAGLIFYIL